MDEILRILIGGLFLILGFFVGNWIARVTREEIEKGKKWFFILVIIGLAGGIYGFIAGNDFLLFSFFFIAIVSSRSLRRSLEMKGEKGGDKKDTKNNKKKKSKNQSNKK